MFCVSCCLLHHLFFAWVGAAVFRFGLFAAGFVLRFCGVLPGAHRCFGCGFLVPHLSARSGCFGEYLNVFAEFSSGFVVFYDSFWNLLRIEF